MNAGKNPDGLKPGRERVISLVMPVFLFLPVFLHCALLTVTVYAEGQFEFGRIDLFIFLLVICYLGLGAIFIRRHDRGILYLVVSYSVLLSLVVFEVFSALSGIGASPGRVPWRPIRVVSTAANTMPGIHGEIRFSINSMGLRGPGIYPPSRSDRILCIGGSSTECSYVSDEKSWPWLLGARLSEALDRPVFVGNAGKSGHFTLHHEYQLSHYEYADRFEWVVVLCGINDLGALLRNRYAQRAKRVPKEALVDSYRIGAYYRRLSVANVLYRFQERFLSPVYDPESQLIQDPGGQGYADIRRKRKRLLAKNTIRSIPPGLPAALNRYGRSLFRIIEVCKRNKQNVLFLTQPTMWYGDMPEELGDLLWQHTPSGAYPPGLLAEMMERYNKRLMEVCKESGIDCIGLSSMLPKDTSVFYDDCHFNVNGCRMVADILIEYFQGKMKDVGADT